MGRFSRQLDKVRERKEKERIRSALKLKNSAIVNKSLGVMRPDLLEYWSKKNDEDPYTISIGSHYRAIWKCSKCKKDFKSEVGNVVKRKHMKCSSCRAFEPTDENRLSITHPHLVSEWDFEKNGENTPDNVSYGRDIYIWWICSDCEHEWKSRLKDRSIQGKGCPRCRKYTSKGVEAIQKYLTKNKIKFEREKHYPDCKDKEMLHFDFFLEDYGLLIEYNGKQHYEPVEHYGGESYFIGQIRRDRIKIEYCEKNNKKLLIISYKEEKLIDKILSLSLKK